MRLFSSPTARRARRPALFACLFVAAIFPMPFGEAVFPSEVSAGSEPAKRVAVVISMDLEPYQQAVAGFKEALETQKVEASLSSHVLKQIAAQDSRLGEEISSGQWDLILCVGSEATRFVQRLELKSPIVFCVVSDPEGQGIVAGERSGAWVAGVSTDIPLDAQFKKFRQAFPDVKRVGVVYDEGSSTALIEKAAVEAKAQGLELVAVPVRDQTAVPMAFTQLRNKVDAVWAIVDQTVYSSESARFILTFVLGNRLPFMAYSPQYVKAGALFALSCDYTDLGRQAGEMAAEALRTGKAPSPSVVGPRKYLLSVNLRVMKVIGRRLPYYFLNEADMLFE